VARPPHAWAGPIEARACSRVRAFGGAFLYGTSSRVANCPAAEARLPRRGVIPVHLRPCFGGAFSSGPQFRICRTSASAAPFGCPVSCDKGGQRKCEVAHTSPPIIPHKNPAAWNQEGTHGTKGRYRRDCSCDGVDHPDGHDVGRVPDFPSSAFACVLRRSRPAFCRRVRASRPSQAVILYSLLPIFSFRAVGTFRKEKGARYWPVLRPFALLYDVSSVPPKVPPDPGALGPGENSPSPGAAFPLLSIMPPPHRREYVGGEAGSGGGLELEHGRTSTIFPSLVPHLQ